jgi:hypothetical protein
VIYEFKCLKCGTSDDYYFHSHEDLKPPRCKCGAETVRVFTPSAIRANGITRPPAGAVEVGDQQPEPEARRDRYEGATAEIMQHISQNSEMEMSRLNG